MISLNILGQDFKLLPEKAIFWEQQKALLIADTHFGKVTHFRKSGIAIPEGAAFKNLSRLQELITKQSPEKVIFLGDLFHSEMNTEWLAFKEVIRKFPEVHFQLITGNHDILHEQSYTNSRFTIFSEPVEVGPFLLSHEPMEHQELYNLCGHIHPGVRMVGGGRQSLRLPCFYFGEKGGILPAFGEFTGLYLLQPKKDDSIFIIVENQVIKAA